jgi:hypothetical protein
VTATNLNNIANAATFDTTGAVDNSTTQISSGAIIVKDGGITPAKLSTGGPSWDSNGNTVLKGVNTNSNAAAGVVGEYTSSTVLVGSATALTTATPKTVTSISLTAGDWDVSAVVDIIPAGGAGISLFAVSVSLNTNTLDGMNNGGDALLQGFTSGIENWLVSPVRRVCVASTTTVYLVARADFSSGSATACGTIRARRVR